MQTGIYVSCILLGALFVLWVGVQAAKVRAMPLRKDEKDEPRGGTKDSPRTTGDNLPAEVRCPACHSARVAEAREVIIGGNKVDTARWVNIGPLKSAAGSSVNLTCMACGVSFNEYIPG